MKFATSYSGLDGPRLVAYARHAEECGFEGLYLPEHIISHPGARIGQMELPAVLPVADPLDALAYVAAATSRLLLGTAVLLLPYHHPVVLAKRLATIDVLSGGRMRLFTVGLGGLPREASATGVDFRRRGRRANEAIEVLRLLWSGDASGVSYHGEFFDFDELCSDPKPLAPLPIHVGGHTEASARRAGRLGDGYFPGGMLSPSERADQLLVAQSYGRELEYTRWASIELTPAALSQYESEGVTRLVVNPTTHDLAEQKAQLSAFADRFGLC